MEREDGTSYIPLIISPSREARMVKRTVPCPASVSPVAPPHRPLPDVEVRLEQFVPDSTRGRSSRTEGTGGSDGGTGSGIRVWVMPSSDSDSEREVTTLALREN